MSDHWVTVIFLPRNPRPADKIVGGGGECSHVERQKPGNDFDKVTALSDNTPHQEGNYPIARARVRKSVSATLGRAVDAVFRLKAAEHGAGESCCKEQQRRAR